MSECGKIRKGACVAKSRCAVAPTPTPTPAPDAGNAPSGQTCCCQTGDSKAVLGMSACTKGGKGKCIKAAECK